MDSPQKQRRIPAMRSHRRMRNSGEWRACRFLRESGHSVIAHNFRTARTELDLISLEWDQELCLHFVEVKSQIHSWKHPLSSQHRLRRHKTRKAARAFLIEYVSYLDLSGHKALASELNELDSAMSFDLIWVKRDGLEYFPSIF
ncbi:MAG: hypothetical protein CMF59_18165 [Leptospiraceae bacterium]|nr:hypothetical protein [Leptospiraceae bacterium]